MSSRVLILSSPEDAHAVRVAQHLSEWDASVAYWKFEPFVHDCKLEFVTDEGKRVFRFNQDGRSIDVSSFDSIWFRRPGAPQSKRFFQPWVSAVVETEAHNALYGMLYSMPCLWVNYPARDAAASLKLFQLEVAKTLGISVPETIVTNDPEFARAFYEKHKGQVIYKLVTEKSNFFLPQFEFPHGIPTLPVREVDLAHLDQVRHAPHLFQQKIEKNADIRVTVIGKKLFAFHIESQSGSGKLDWRTDYDVPMRVCELPDHLSEKCLQLLRRLGLNYGAIDFCLDTEGRYVFLEINPAGQYMWLENLTKVPLSKELALLLAGKSEALVSYESAAFA